jgi:predicted acetyltransferase
MEMRALRSDELEQAWSLGSEAFNAPVEREALFLERSRAEDFTGIFDGARLVAQAQAHPFQQFFGGRSVSMGGVASVATAPDQRGRGLGRRVMRGCLEAMRERGDAISTLFPATLRFYRSLGWEVAGSLVHRSLEPTALQGIEKPEGVRVRKARDDDAPGLRGCYQRLAASSNGFLDRSEWWWSRIFEAWKTRRLYVAENDAGVVDGYVSYRQVDGEYSDLGGDFEIRVGELIATTPDASRALWRLLGSWAPQVERILYQGPFDDPLLLLVTEQNTRVLAEGRWVTRLVNARAAIESRGYPAAVDAEVHLRLCDEILGDNDGDFVLRVVGGEAVLEPGGKGEISLDVGAATALYTGASSCAALARAGRLQGGSSAAWQSLDAVFAAASPWMPDEF